MLIADPAQVPPRLQLGVHIDENQVNFTFDRAEGRVSKYIVILLDNSTKLETGRVVVNALPMQQQYSATFDTVPSGRYALKCRVACNQESTPISASYFIAAANEWRTKWHIVSSKIAILY